MTLLKPVGWWPWLLVGLGPQLEPAFWSFETADHYKVCVQNLKLKTDVSEIESTLEELLLLIAGDKATESEWL